MQLNLSPDEQIKFDGTPGALRLGDIDAAGVTPIIEALRAHPPTLTIFITSNGGYVSAGWGLLNEMELAQAAGTSVVCVVEKGAFSMAAVVVQGCNVRLMRRGSALMFHTASIGSVGGNQWDLERAAREIEAVNDRIAIYVAGRLNIPQAEYEKNVADRDWWVGVEEALEVGAIDAALPPLR
jgi:ATP-dependent protease ClpP protease subunit